MERLNRRVYQNGEIKCKWIFILIWEVNVWGGSEVRCNRVKKFDWYDIVFLMLFVKLN